MKRKLLYVSIGILVVLAIIVNITNNKYINKNKEEIKEIDNKSLAVYIQNDNGNYDKTTNIPLKNSGYILNSSKSVCEGSTTISWDSDTWGLELDNINKENTKCYLYFDKAVITIPDIIAANNPKESPTTFSGAATTDEGVFKVEDGMYGNYSYYWRGATTTNHVIFANKCWRIVRINGDNTMRLIYNGTPTNGTCPGNGENTEAVIMGSSAAEKYYATSDGQYNNSSYVGWTYTLGSQRPSNNETATSSNAKTRTEAWFNNSSNFTDAQRAQVVEGKFCNDKNIKTEQTWSATGDAFYYAAYEKLFDNKIPTLNCANTNDIYILKVGTITVDELIFAGGWNAENNKFYLYTGEDYWTISPSHWDGYGYARVFCTTAKGYISYCGVNATFVGLRPVINLGYNTTFKSDGLGTENNPYIVN